MYSRVSACAAAAEVAIAVRSRTLLTYCARRARSLSGAAAAAPRAPPDPESSVQHGRSALDRALAASFVEPSLRERVAAAEGGLASLVFSTPYDRPGELGAVLRLFERNAVNMTRIESRPSKHGGHEFLVDVDSASAPRLERLLRDLNERTRGTRLGMPATVPWFPMHVRDIDSFSTKTLDAGAELEADHPGFSDAAYRERRRRIVEAAASFRHGQEIPRVAYTPEEVATWGVVYAKLRGFTREYAVDTYNAILPDMERHCGYGERSVPQLQDISDFLRQRTGFTLRPVGGLLSARDFLNGLAFRVFFSTQYIRHHSRPLYTPEPDIVHELMGHAPMFADADFADFSHEIGLASLGASDEDIKKLATCYWFSVEFGLCLAEGGRAGDRRAYGAGLLSSFGELAYACSPTRPAGGEDRFPEYRPFDPVKVSQQSYPITTYQPTYFVADSLADAKDKMRAFCEDNMSRRFGVAYDAKTESVRPDRAVVRGPYVVTLQTG